MNGHEHERLEDLLVDRALWGLDQDQSEELEQILIAGDELTRLDLDMAAAALDLAMAGEQHEPMPAHVKARVEASGIAHLAMSRGLRPIDMDETEDGFETKSEAGTKMAARPTEHRPKRDPSSGLATWVPWLVAAASVLLSVFLLIDGSRQPTAAELRQQVLRSGGVEATWAVLHDDAKGTTGGLVWNGKTQKGVMRFRGLPVNDPNQMQYQLWIFDKNQSDKTPVDGGVFDIDKATGEVLVTIDPKIQVGEAFQVAVTAERPGGVVVSKRDKLLLLAKLGP